MHGVVAPQRPTCTVFPSPISSPSSTRPPRATPRPTPSRWNLHRSGGAGRPAAGVLGCGGRRGSVESTATGLGDHSISEAWQRAARRSAVWAPTAPPRPELLTRPASWQPGWRPPAAGPQLPGRHACSQHWAHPYSLFHSSLGRRARRSSTSSSLKCCTCWDCSNLRQSKARWRHGRHGRYERWTGAAEGRRRRLPGRASDIPRRRCCPGGAGACLDSAPGGMGLRASGTGDCCGSAGRRAGSRGADSLVMHSTPGGPAEQCAAAQQAAPRPPPGRPSWRWQRRRAAVSKQHAPLPLQPPTPAHLLQQLQHVLVVRHGEGPQLALRVPAPVVGPREGPASTRQPRAVRVSVGVRVERRRRAPGARAFEQPAARGATLPACNPPSAHFTNSLRGSL